MKKLSLLLAVMLFSTSAAAARVMKDTQGNHIRLTNEACTSTAGMLAQLPTALRLELKAAEVYWQGKSYAACYREDGEYILIVDEEGDSGAMNASEFKKDLEV